MPFIYSEKNAERIGHLASSFWNRSSFCLLLLLFFLLVRSVMATYMKFMSPKVQLWQCELVICCFCFCSRFCFSSVQSVFLPYLWLSALGHGYLMIVSCKYQKATGENLAPFKVQPRLERPREIESKQSQVSSLTPWLNRWKVKGGVAASQRGACKCHQQS